MGSFFTNVQVLIDKTDQDLQKDRIISKIKHWTSEKYVYVEGEDDAERTIVISSIPNNSWLTIYDEATECQDLEQLDELASQASSAVDSFAVGILMHDSDLLYLRLFKSGRLIDFYSNSKKGARGNPNRWTKLIGDENVSVLKETWKDKTLFAEEILHKTAELVGWYLSACFGGYNILNDLDIEKSMILRFKLRHKPKESLMEVTSGKPKFVRGSYGSNMSSPRLGQQFSFSGSFLNIGGPSRGIDVAIWGPIVHKGLVEINSVIIMKWDIASLRSKKQNLGPDSIEGNVEEVQSHTGEKSYVAHFALFDISNGYREDIIQDDNYDIEKAFYLQKNSEFHVRVIGKVIKEGRDLIRINCIPHEDRKEGQNGYEAELNVLPPLAWKPMNSLDDMSFYGYVEDLQIPHKIFAYITFKYGIHDRADLIVPIIKRWIEDILLREEGELSASYAINSAIYQNKHYKILPQKLFMGKRWSDNIDAFPQLNSMNVTVNASDSGIEIKMGDNTAKPEFLPYLVFWCDIKNKHQIEIEKIRLLMESIIDELAKVIPHNQSFIARWRNVPDAQYRYNSFLRACDIRTPTTKAWCERFLKGVSDTMWLSDELFRHIDKDMLKRIAEVVPISDVVKIRLKAGYSLNDLENALFPILARKEDSKE